MSVTDGTTTWLTVEEVAMRLERSAATIWRYVRAGKLHTKSILGRTVFDASEVEDFARPIDR
jgi:predicted DNA-binding transcriptional regulator AlpA